MTVFLISFLVIALAALAMALGVLAGRRPIDSGCGSLLALEEADIDCEICGGSCETKQRSRSGGASSPLGDGGVST